MWSEPHQQFVPVPDRELTAAETKYTKFHVGERVYVKGMSFCVEEILPQSLSLVPYEVSTREKTKRLEQQSPA